MIDSKRKKEEIKVNKANKKRTRMSRGEMEKAVKMWREGDQGLDQYLIDHGIGHIGKWKQNQKARYGKPEEPTLGDAMEGMKNAAAMFFGACEDMGLNIGKTEPEESSDDSITMEYRTTGISTQIGDWQYFKKSGYLDWTPLDGNGIVSMSLEEWKELMKLFPEVLKVLEVEL